MYEFTGQKCPICQKPFTAEDDIVVCPECGTPHHRTCWEVRGCCANTDRHAESFEWTPEGTPETQQAQQAEQDQTQAQQPNPATSNTNAANNGQASSFDYSQLYGNSYTPPEQSAKEQPDSAQTMDPDSTIENIPVSDWANFIGKSNYLYMLLFKQMEMFHRRAVFSGSAAFFGPFYFAYRKAWKPAALFMGLMLLTSTPSLLYMLQMTGSPLTAGMSADLLYRLAASANVLNIAIMALRGFYGFYMYKKTCIERINRIRANYPDDNQRQYVLRAQGGTSWAAVFGMVVLLMVFSTLVGFLMGPNLDALYAVMG